MDGASSTKIWYQAHRGSVNEAPENTMIAYRYAWQFPGAIPEIDVRTTSDGELVCIHDATPARTTNAPAGVRERLIDTMTLADVRQLDAGVRFGAYYANQRVPVLDDVLMELASAPDRRLYVEPKAVELRALRDRLDAFDVREQVIFVSGYRDMLLAIQEIFPGAPAMTWVGGSPDLIIDKVARWRELGLEGISQLQLHLAAVEREPVVRFALADEFLLETKAWLAKAGVALQLCPFALDAPALQRLLALGVAWYVTDEPGRFWRTLAAVLGGEAKQWQSGLIYHITTGRAWREASAAGMYHAESLAGEGFIHCSTRSQLLAVANAFYRQAAELVVLAIDPNKAVPLLRYEPPAQTSDEFGAERFPHLYGPLPVEAVVQIVDFVPTAGGDYSWPSTLV
jgi:uncharacterized protein (DUF952 family)/glycerophosphoryl diester phosphodiesterase